MKYYTFMMLKPDAFMNHYKEDVLSYLKQNDLTIEKAKIIQVDMEVMKTLLSHYQQVIDQKGKDIHFVEKLFHTFYYDGPHHIMPMIISYDKEDIISYTRELVGKTNPMEASHTSIRGKYSQDSYQKADKENRLVHNVIHASDSMIAAKREFKIWKKYL